MEFFSLAPLLAVAPGPDNAPSEALARVARQLFATPSEASATSSILALLAGVAIQILANWIAAKVVIGNENGTLARATHLWLLGLLVGLGMAAVLIIGLIVAGSSQPPVLLAVAAGGWALLSFLLALLLTAKVFVADLLRSFGILVVAFILILAGQTALHRALESPTLVRWPTVQRMLVASPEDRSRRLRHILAGDPIAVIELELDRLSQAAERKKPFSERQAGLRAAFAALETQRQQLKSTDTTGRADYEAARQRYEALVKGMRTDYAASLTAPGAR